MTLIARNLGGPAGVRSGGTGTSTVFTQGSVVFAGASGVYSQDNANFFWDAGNHRLGIDTASPAYPLHIETATNNKVLIFFGKTNTYDWGIGVGSETVAGAYIGHAPALTTEYFWRALWTTGDGPANTFHSPNNQTGQVVFDVLGQTGQTADLQQLHAGASLVMNVTAAGKITTYGGTTLVGDGVPAQYVTIDLTAQGGALAAQTLIASVAASGIFRISWVATVTRAATTSSTLGGTAGFQVTYTDPDDSVAKTSAAAGAPSAGVNQSYSQTNQGNSTATQASGVVVVQAKVGTALNYSFGYTSSGGTSMQYNLHIRVEKL